MSSTHSAVKTNKAPNATQLNAHNVFAMHEKQNYIAKLFFPIFCKTSSCHLHRAKYDFFFL